MLKDNPLIVYPRHARMLGGDPNSTEVQYSEKHGIWYVVSPKLGYPFNTDLLCEEGKKELAKRMAVIAKYWLEKMQEQWK